MKECESEEASEGTIPESDTATVLEVISQVLETGTFDSSHLPKDPVLRKRLEEIVVAIGAVQNFTLCLSKGDLDSRLDVKGISAGCLKSLQSNLKHLTWQAQQIAAGDFSQRVDFMGEFSEAFNYMVRALDAARAEMKQRELELSTLNAQLLTEVTVRRQAEETLRLQNQIFETIAEGVYLIRARDGVIVYTNSKFEKMFGYEKGELIGEHVSVVNAPEEKMSPRDTAEEIMKALNEKGEWRGEVKNIRKDGTVFWCLAVVSTFEHPEFGSVWISAHTDITKRKQVEEALERSYSVLHGVIESPKEVVIFALDRQYRYIAFNENHRHTMQQIWGVDIVLGNSMLEYIRRPDDRNKAIINFDRALSGESFTVVEAYGDTALERRWYEDIYNPITDEKGNVIGLTLFLTDITNRKHMEEALRESEEKFRGVAERSSDIIMLTDEKGRITYIAPSVEKILGYNPDEVVGKTPRDLVHPDDLDSVYELIRKNATGETKTEDIELRVRKKDGDYAILDISVSPVIEEGIFSGMQVIGRDITARKKAEEEFLKAQQRIMEHDQFLQRLIDTILNPIFYKDKNGIYTGCNTAFERYIGFSKNQIVGKSVYDIAPKDLADIYYANDQKLLDNPGVQIYESRVKYADGSIHDVIFNKATFTDLWGNTEGLVGVIIDISERKKAEEEERLTRERFETLVKVSEMRDANETKLAEYVMAAACRMTGSSLAFIGTMTPDESVMDIVAWSSSAMQDCRVAVSPIHFPVQKAGIWADAIRTRKPKIVNDYAAPHHGKKGLPEGHVKITRFLSLPILYKGKVVMVAAVANKPDEYDDTDVTRLTLLMQGVWGNLQRRRSEDALKKSEEQYRILFEESPLSLWEEDFSDIKVWIDTKTNEGIEDLRIWLESHPEDVAGCAIMVNVLHINRATMALFGAASLKEFSEGLSKVFTEDSYDMFREEIIALAEGKNEFEGETQIQTLKGERKNILLKMTVVPGYEQTLSKILVSIIDISDLKRIHEALQRANKQLNLLSSITRHDILNQLMALKGYLELSQDVIGKPETLSGYLKKEQQVANTIEHQITFTKDYQELGVTAPAWQNVNACIKKAVAGLPMRDVHVDTDRTDLEIFADRLFEKVFYNLIDNALKYGGDLMTTIRISSEESDRGLTIVCEDDGVGITDEDKKKLFRKGFGKHTGLGLFLSREILAITGITITENGTPGKGARFEITVPKGMYRFTGTGQK